VPQALDGLRFEEFGCEVDREGRGELIKLLDERGPVQDGDGGDQVFDFVGS
jgi:hypothetical protein